MDQAEEAAELRRAGVGVKRIAAQLGVSHHRVQVWLRDVPVPSAMARPRAKDGAREAALALRAEGRTYDEIATELGVSKGTLSLWLRDLPGPMRNAFGRSAEECRRMARERWDSELARRDGDRQQVMSAATASVGSLTVRELELVAVTAYWCEGTKSKPWRRKERLALINSDAGVITVWLRWLALQGVGPERLRFRLSIHESADLARATAYWAEVVGVAPADFGKLTLKRHNPKTVRLNTGDGYVGCLTVYVLQGRELYQRMAGIWTGVVDGGQWVDVVGRDACRGTVDGSERSVSGRAVPDRPEAGQRTLNP